MHYMIRTELMRASFEYIEVFYNRKRLHSSLGYKSPLQFFEDWRNSQNQIEPAIPDLPLGGLKTEAR